MRSLRELANDYERWADENEALASQIMNNGNNFYEDREKQRYASILAAEAESFRQQAARLRASRVAITGGIKSLSMA